MAGCMISHPMADLEQLALKRDRGYLLRLVLMLAVGLLASMFLWQGLTGDRVSDCVADAFLGQDAPAEKGDEPGSTAAPKPD